MDEGAWDYLEQNVGARDQIERVLWLVKVANRFPIISVFVSLFIRALSGAGLKYVQLQQFFAWNGIRFRRKSKAAPHSNVVFEARLTSGLQGKVCLFSHFDPQGRVPKSTIQFLEEIRRMGFCIAFCSTSLRINETDLQAVSTICSLVVHRENIGHDFGSWKTLMVFLNGADFIETLLLTNDSILGPLTSVAEALSFFLKSDHEVFAFTDSMQYRPHLQSYFICVKQKVLVSKEWISFWSDSNFRYYLDKRDTVMQQEVVLGSLLISRFKTFVSCEYFHLIRKFPHRNFFGMIRPLNPSFHYWDILLSHQRFPFIKKQVLDEFLGGRRKWEDMDLGVIRRKLVEHIRQHHGDGY